MLDIRLIREQPDEVRAALSRRGATLGELLDEVRRKDEEWRASTTEAESLRAKQREESEALAQAKRAGEDVSARMGELQGIAAEVKRRSEQAASEREELDALLLRLPNLPDASAANGPEDELVRVVGEPPSFAFPPRDHLELAGEQIDMERAAKLSGARFAYLRGDLVLVELALVRWALQKLYGHGFQPVIPPVLVRERALFGTGFLPDTEDQIYGPLDDGLYLAGTSEVAHASLHDGEILEAERLPLRYAGFSPCFRREAGAAGRDTRGIFRVHQFDKVEMFSFSDPARSAEEHERILAIEEEILQELAIPYRVVNIAVNDLGSSAAKKYDCEAWIPSQERYRELTSCSNTTDFQARRLEIRARREGEKRTETVHTLNGTAVAVGRTLIALLENGQREDASVILPECLAEAGAPRQLRPLHGD
ncbi:MAG TPA: serine--tRNA ligase [Solirubrobacteraceae bacterium]|nr:serine--tRNA ligase [Solirubrobacteraceae bacterium]